MARGRAREGLGGRARGRAVSCLALINLAGNRNWSPAKLEYSSISFGNFPFFPFSGNFFF